MEKNIADGILINVFSFLIIFIIIILVLRHQRISIKEYLTGSKIEHMPAQTQPQLNSGSNTSFISSPSMY